MILQIWKTANFDERIKRFFEQIWGSKNRWGLGFFVLISIEGPLEGVSPIYDIHGLVFSQLYNVSPWVRFYMLPKMKTCDFILRSERHCWEFLENFWCKLEHWPLAFRPTVAICSIIDRFWETWWDTTLGMRLWTNFIVHSPRLSTVGSHRDNVKFWHLL